MSAFAKCEVSGPGAEGWLNSILTNRAPTAIGRVTLSYLLTERGGVRAEFTLTRIGSERFYLISAGALETHDFDTLEKLLPADGGARIDKVTTQRGVLVLAGPRSREVLAKVADIDVSNKAFPWLTARRMSIKAASVIAMRVNFVGELGYEFHHPIEMQNAIFDALMEAGAPFGVKPFGIRAMDSLRLEKSYKLVGRELSIEYAALESDLQRFVDFDNRAARQDGRGRAAAASRQDPDRVLPGRHATPRFRAHVVYVPGLHVPAARCAGQEREHVRLFAPAISKDALKKIGQEVRSWRLHRRTPQLFSELARWVNPIVRGWMQYYGAFYRSALYPLLTRINAYLMRWVRKKYRRFQGRREFQQAWQRVTTQYPRFLPTGSGQPPSRPSGDQGDKSRMNREVHVRICGSRRVRLPPATRPAQGPAVRAARAGHRQAGQLPGRSPRAHVVGGAPAVVVSEPRRELSPAHPTTRTGDETLQIVAACATVPVRLQRHLRALPAATASARRDRMANRDGRPLRGLASGHRARRCRLKCERPNGVPSRLLQTQLRHYTFQST